MMRIRSLSLEDYPPIKKIELNDLGSTVVIAGANGSGKTRLKEAIVASLQGNPMMNMVVEATRPDEKEEKYFNGDKVVVTKGEKNQILRNYINSRKFGAGRYVGSVVQIDSKRSVESINYSAVNWLAGDPDDADSPGNFYFSSFIDRWKDFSNYLHQKSAARDKKLAERMKADPAKTGEEHLQALPDPLNKYKEIFSAALPGKTLSNIDPAKPREFQYQDISGQTLPFSTLSSGEQEVIKILFDVARKDIRHSVIIVDEPELHLHPTLTFQLIETLKNIGQHTNQYIFLTHSPDLISTYYATGDVYFIDTSQTGENQAHRLSDLAVDHSDIVPLIGQNLGMFAVGKKLVFVEGENSSIDRLAYHKVAQSVNPEIRVIPGGSVKNLMLLSEIEHQIRNSVFGIEIYLIRDRDGLSDDQVAELEKGGRLRCLKRRHIENYFLDADVLEKVADRLYLTHDQVQFSAAFLQIEIERIATQSLSFTLYKSFNEYVKSNFGVRAPSVKGVQDLGIADLKAALLNEVATNVEQLKVEMAQHTLDAWLDQEENKLSTALLDGGWPTIFQGKYIFSVLCGSVLKDDHLRIRNAYVDIALDEKPEVLADVFELFAEI